MTTTTVRPRPFVLAVAPALVAATLALTSSPIATAAVSPQGLEACASGSLCRWTGTSYQGQMQSVSTTGSTINVSGTRQSLWVNRSGAVLLFSAANGAGSQACYPAGSRVATLTGWQASPGSVRLISGTC